MSLVRYVNKKTGWVSIYESTSYYDPIKKASRPKRTYIGYEDPVTKEFVPSSGKPGRKKSNDSSKNTSFGSSVTEYGKLLKELEKKQKENEKLTLQIASMNERMNTLCQAVNEFKSTLDSIISSGKH